MPRVSLNLKDAKSRKPVPDDTYEVVVKKFEGPIKGPKAHYIKAYIDITEGNYEGHRFFHNLPIEGEGAGIFADFVSKLTGEEIDVDQLEELDIDTDELLDVPFGIVTKQREFPEGSNEFQDNIAKILKAR